MLLVYVPCKDKKEATHIAKKLLEARAAGCCNIVETIDSFYWWKGKITNDKESLLICKTLERKKANVKKIIKKYHSYTIPCIAFIQVKDINKEYGKWLKKEVI